MADSSLDDFFAKKDKSKKSKKFTTTDQIAKKLEEGGKKPEKTIRKDKEKSVNSSLSVGSAFMQHQEQVCLLVIVHFQELLNMFRNVRYVEIGQ